MSKTKTFSLYLAKSHVKKFNSVLTTAAKERIRNREVVIKNSSRLGSRAIAYVFENVPRAPTWLHDLKEVFEGIPTINNKSSSALVIFEQADHVFITCFSHGWQYIEETSVEPDFGLKVAINSLSDTKVNRIERSHLGEAIKGVSHSAFQRDLQAFGIDEALDLVRRITGRADDDDFAGNLAGSTSLKITREMSLSELPEVASEAFSRYKSDAYKKTGFQIIDKVRPILDQSQIAVLDNKSVEAIKFGEDNFELAMPGWSEEDIVYYGFSGLRLQRRFPDLLMANYRAELGTEISSLDVNAIAHKHGVFAEFANEAIARKRWSIKKALIGSMVVDGGLYAASEGGWYRLDQQFKDDVDASFKQVVEKWASQPLKMIQKVSADGKKIGYESELLYNRRCAEAYGQICLDQEIISVPSIPFGKFEACDLLDIASKRLIHVKKSSRQSSVLSHFFKQGSNSARILKTFPDARKALVEKVRETAGEDKALALQMAFTEGLDSWAIEFHIIDAPRPDGEFAIPFFSRITLRDEARMLRGMAFHVALKFIPT